jgi:hypothetical protein
MPSLVVIPSKGRPQCGTAALCESNGLPFVILCGDDDETLPEYRERWGERVEVFDRAEWCRRERALDTFDKHGVTPARNYILHRWPRCWMLDDDIQCIKVSRGKRNVKVYGEELAKTLEAVERFGVVSGACCVGLMLTATMFPRTYQLRKAGYQCMFFTGNGTPEFRGLVAEDEGACLTSWMRGTPWLGLMFVGFDSTATKKEEGGLTDIYRSEEGTDVRRTAYLLMQAPGAVVLKNGRWQSRYGLLAPKIVDSRWQR